MESVLPWFVRFVHVMAAMLWIGSASVLSMVVLPRLARGGATSAVGLIAGPLHRFMQIAAGLTILAGFALIALTRGYANVGRGEWGILVLISMVGAIALAIHGAVSYRPLLARAASLSVEDVQRGARHSLIDSVGGLLILALMTWMLYASGG